MFSMISTPTALRNLENVRIALRTFNAVLLQGEIGCGKSMAVRYLAEEFGAKESMIQINVDDSFDNKDLLGQFSATNTPGVFEWVPGPLTIAVEKGYWILMEDIDLASFDVFSVILSLLESSTLLLADKNLVIESNPKFKLIATQQLFSSGSMLFSRKTNSIPFVELWGTVLLQATPPPEMCIIAQSLYNNVPESVLKNLASLVSDNTNTPLISLRALLKWSARVSRRLSKANINLSTTPNIINNNNNDKSAFISSTVREIFLKEAYDCIVAKHPNGRERELALGAVAAACGVSENVALALVDTIKPVENLSHENYSVGRVTLPLFSSVPNFTRDSRVAFAPTVHAMTLLERIAACVQANEHVLLTGETGVGKTFIVQYLADQLNQRLIVHNLNQQTDASDFMGGWKPLDVGVPIRDAYLLFTECFHSCFNPEKNISFLNTLQQAVNQRSWDRALRQIIKGCQTFWLKNERSPFSGEMQEKWRALQAQSEELLDTVEKTRSTFSFFYEEGSLVRAWREGYWILLDEVNLAPTEVLERVSSVLGDVNKLFLTDRPDLEAIPKHKHFHVFSNMNPPTDVGKKDLPPSLRSRFTEFYVSEPFNEADINIVVREYIGFIAPDTPKESITHFFLDCVQNVKVKLCALDGESKPPSFSLRTLTRALSYVRKAAPLYGYTTALYDGLMLGFATPLQRQFHAVVEQLIVKNIFNDRKPTNSRLPPAPQTGRYVPYEHIWVPAGDRDSVHDASFILTDSVKGHLRNLARAVFANRPVLLEGPTSSGKSSMVKYLAELTGNQFVRINNHEGSEVQEYLGRYVTDEHGKLRFIDGILVSAVRHGYWVVLDELNLAPTDVLEALNRLLDDNRELFVPDTQETIQPHPQLRIFATQNPAGLYGGRKLLSRAFRNRFLELTVDEIPNSEISTILRERYALPEKFAGKMVEIMASLQTRRQNSQIFAGRHGFITPRDLFRWAERTPTTFQELAEHGFLLLGERCRKRGERQIVKDVIESTTRVEIDEDVIYAPFHWPFVQKYFDMVESSGVKEFQIVWTASMRRLFTIVGICLEHREPVLLVGETGSSKTTVCQLWAALLHVPVRIVNCHQHSEAADFLGSFRPAPPDRRHCALFEWRNGPLVQSMVDGDFFVLDEISLAEDSVLERLNSVLEPTRSITLAEKSSSECITAHDRFRVLATMNPGGDFGKKELSPALRNRFTEVYVRPTTDKSEISHILSQRLDAGLEDWADKMAEVLCCVSAVTALTATQQHISIRDVIGWASFFNAAHRQCPSAAAFLQGLDAVILDGIGVGTGQSELTIATLKRTCTEKARELCGLSAQVIPTATTQPFWTFFKGMSEPTLPPEMQRRFFFGTPTTQSNLSKLMRASILKKAVLLEGSPGVGKTSIVEALGCALGHPVVRINLSDQTDIMDLLGTFLPCPSSSFHEEGEGELVGTTSPTESGPQFVWSDGILLRALKRGEWVILDELNLASQSVLEGLNALLDHRTSVFIPELNEEFHAHDSFRIFACQNPLLEGGGRKGLPRSFLNRFLRVHMDAFQRADLIAILKATCPDIADEILERMVAFVEELQLETMGRRSFGIRGSPWEFNLRDLLRWAKLMQAYDQQENPTCFADMLFLQRMRIHEDEARCQQLLTRHFSQFVDVHSASRSDFLIYHNAIYFNQCRLATCIATPTFSSSSIPSASAIDVVLLPSKARLVRSLLVCAEQSQFVLLVGAAGAGKTFALKTAAALVGARLVTFSMTASCDTVDLLGGFNQVEGRQGEFEWSDSLVLQAMQQGDWLVLDNVNYCNASVLDRLNPLVEPNGILSVNEQGLINGQVRVVRPHPNFRLFATLNPKYGELSRAMRNRAVELHVFPLCIPSPEVMMLAAPKMGNYATATSTEDEVLNKLMDFHRSFVLAAFSVDTSVASSGALQDGLAAGAPNIFTLHHACALLAEVASDDLSDPVQTLEKCIRHRYIDNRSGHWRYKVEELLKTLHDILEKPFSLRSGAAVWQLAAAFRLQCQSADVAAALVQRRVAREALALQTLFALGTPTGGTLFFPQKSDVLLHFILEECNDSVPLCELSQERKRVLREIFPDDNMDLAATLLDEKLCRPAMLGTLYCRATFCIGSHVSKLSCLSFWEPDNSSRSVAWTDSVLLNQNLARILCAAREYLQCLTTPSTLHVVLSALVPFIYQLQQTTSVTRDNYVSSTARAVLLHTACSTASHSGEAVELVAALEAFLDALKRYLDLPFPLFGEACILRDYVPLPHITTKEERSLVLQWQRIAYELRAETQAGGTQQLLCHLWEGAAFRSEYAAVQLLLTLLMRTFLEHTSMHHHLLQMLRGAIMIFIEQCTQKLPCFSELEMALWHGLLSAPPQEVVEVIHQSGPILICRFIMRYGARGVWHLFPGTWAGAAAGCLQHALRVSVLAVGQTHNDYANVLSGLGTFLSVCPVAPSRLFADWEHNSQRELQLILQASSPRGSASAMDVGPETRWAFFVGAVRNLLPSISGAAFNAHRYLLNRLASCMEAVEADVEGDCRALKSIALVCALKCRLLLSTSPIDPMYRRQCEMESARDERDLLQRVEAAFRWAEQITLSDNSPSPQLSLLSSLRIHQEERLQRAAETFVERPDLTGARYAALIQQLYHLSDALFSDQRLDAVMFNYSGGDTTAAVTPMLIEARVTWSELLHQGIAELLDAYGGYEDVTLNFAQAGLLACMAARASCYIEQSRLQNEGVLRNGTRTLFAVSETLQLLHFPFHWSGRLPLPSMRTPGEGMGAGGGMPPLRHMLDYLDGCLTWLHGSTPQATDRAFVSQLLAAYRHLYHAIEALEDKEEQAREMAVLYKEKALIIEGDDEKLLRKLKELLPSYEHEFVDLDAGALEADATAEFVSIKDPSLAGTEERSAKHARIMFQERDGAYLRRLLEVYAGFFERLVGNCAEQGIMHHELLLESFVARFDVLSSELSRFDEDHVTLAMAEGRECLLLGGFASRAALLQARLFRCRERECAAAAMVPTLEERCLRGFNIYLDADPDELCRFSKPLERLLISVDALATTYPDTVSLQRCQRVGRKIAALPALTTPLMKIMSGCEVLLRECYEWERNAAQAVSIMTHITELSAFVLRWRRLELHCWSHVFRAKRNEFELRAAVWWFLFYDVVHQDESVPEEAGGVLNASGGAVSPMERLSWRCKDLFERLSQYLWGACYGDFSTRLQLVRGVAYELLATHGTRAPLANVALHVADYFAQFTPLIIDRAAEAVRPIEKDMEEFAKIMRWEDSNYYAVRATCEKAHLKMARALSSLDECLRTPVRAVITAEEQRMQDDPALGVVLPLTLLGSTTEKHACASGNGGLEVKRMPVKRPRFHTKVGPAAGSDGNDAADAGVHGEALGTWSCRTVRAAFDFFCESTEEVAQRVKALQAPKTPQQMKIRALKTLFDVLHESGVPHTHELQEGPWEVVFASTEPLLSCRSINNDQGAVVVYLESSAHEYYRFARWLELMRKAERGKPHADLSNAQINRATGISESLFTHAGQVVRLVCGLVELCSLLHALQVLVRACGRAAVPGSIGSQFLDDSFAEDATLLDAALGLCCSTQSLHADLEWLLAHSNLPSATADAARPTIAELAHEGAQLYELCTQNEPLRRGQFPLPMSLARQLAGVARKMDGVCVRLQQLGRGSSGSGWNDASRVATAAAAAHSAAIAAFLSQCDAACSYGDDAAGVRRLKRQRKEAAEQKGSGGWSRRAAELQRELQMAFMDDPVVTTALSPTATPSSITTAVYSAYQARVSSLMRHTHSANDTLHVLLRRPHSPSGGGAETAEVFLPRLTLSERSELLQRISRSLSLVRGVQNALTAVLAAHASFGVVVTRLFVVLIQKGFCKADDQDDDDDAGDGGGGQQQQLQSGTGMDDGEGEKDVTNEMENEDQLMNMKDREESPEEEGQNKKGDVDEQDKAADVETDFNANKKSREESEGSDEEGEESEKEMGSVEGTDERDRKKTRKDRRADNDMRGDEADQSASEVPEDELLEHDRDGDEETGGFEDKEKEIRDAEERRDGEHELVADDERTGQLSDDDNDNSSGRSLSSEDKSGSDASSEGSAADADSNEDGSENRRDDTAPTDDERGSEADSTRVQREADLEEASVADDDDGDGDSNSDGSSGCEEEDAKDANVFEGGLQDDETGQEATDRRKREEQQPPPASPQPDTTGNEEEQPDPEQQEQDDAGRSWKKQQEANRQAQRRDHSERTRAQHNPYHVVKEALQRHERRVQQLNLNQRVEIKKDDRGVDTEQAPEPEKKPEEMEEDMKFEFDEAGEEEGMAAADQPPRYEEPTEAEQDLDGGLEKHAEDDESDSDEDEAEKAPRDDSRRRRQGQAEEVRDEAAEEDGAREKNPRGRKKVRLLARAETGSEESTDTEECGEDAAADAVTGCAGDEKMNRGRRLWQEQEAAVQGLSQQLCEQLRLILSPTLADKLQGDYKSGKRLNMKRIIPYIASQFKKDRIWLRRTKPHRRTYQTLVALDDSLSMQCNNAGVMSCRAVALLAKALQQLEVGEIGVVCFGKETRVVHGLEEPFIADSGPRAFSEITFAQGSTNLKLFLETTLDYLDTARERAQGQSRSTTQRLQQVLFIISDGQITEDRVELRRLLVRAEENHQMIVFVLLDLKAADMQCSAGAEAAGDSTRLRHATAPPLKGSELKGLSTAERMRRLKAARDARLERVHSSSILDMQVVEFKHGKVIRRPYMEDFPFPYYLIVRELEQLPEIIADAMRQWFELMSAGQS